MSLGLVFPIFKNNNKKNPQNTENKTKHRRVNFEYIFQLKNDIVLFLHYQNPVKCVAFELCIFLQLWVLQNLRQWKYHPQTETFAILLWMHLKLFQSINGGSFI